MRALLTLLLGLLIGAAGFHLYYMRLAPLDRCGWDHPLDSGARATCRRAAIMAARAQESEAARGQRQLDDLIGAISR